MDVVFILGMHRSGTSCLAACLQACGLYLGEVNQIAGTANNPHGTFEPREVNQINERLLGSWIRPRVPVIARDSDRAAISICARSMIERARAAGITRLGIKDPRMLLVLHLWREHFERVQFVATFRSAAAVHRSIAARRDLRTWKPANYKAWKIYNRALLELSARETVYFVPFEVDSHVYLERIRSVSKVLGLQYCEEPVLRSFDPQARRQMAAPPRDPEVAMIQTELAQRASCWPAVPSASVRLDL